MRLLPVSSGKARVLHSAVWRRTPHFHQPPIGDAAWVRAVHSCLAAKRNIVSAVESVARRLGNTKAVCRKCYIHPVVLAAYEAGELRKTRGSAEAGSPPVTAPAD